jgi:hypothetical protein
MWTYHGFLYHQSLFSPLSSPKVRWLHDRIIHQEPALSRKLWTYFPTERIPWRRAPNLELRHHLRIRSRL